MSQFPLDTESDLVEAVNYLLSGPTGSGQNFQGVSAVGEDAITSGPAKLVQTYFTGTPYFGPAITGFRSSAEQPGTQDDYADPLLLPDIYYPVWNTLPGGLPITSITPVDPTGRDIEITVTLGSLTNESQGPWANGQQVVITGVTPSTYNKTYTVVDFNPSSTTVPFDTVTLRSTETVTWSAYTSGGTAAINDFTLAKDQRFFTGNQAIVAVSGPGERVFITSQSGELIVYTYTKFVAIASYDPLIKFQINRYKAVATTTLPDSVDGRYYQGYEWAFDTTLVNLKKPVSWDLLGTQVYANPFTDVIYNNIIDNPNVGLYLYAFQIAQDAERDASPDDGAVLIVGARTTGVRSFTAQVIKN